MDFTPEQIDKLRAPLDPSKVKDRKQGGATVSYVEGWHVIAEANRIFGEGGWSRETILLEETNKTLVDLKGNNGPYQQWRVGFMAKVKITVGDVVREGTGFGSGMGKPESIGDAYEGAIKEAETDAMKRALMTFGNPFGLALYDKTKANVGEDWAAQIPRISAAIQNATSPDKLSSLWDHPKTQNVLDHLSKDQIAKLNEERTTKLKSLTASFEKDSEAA